eukprot:UN13435
MIIDVSVFKHHELCKLKNMKFNVFKLKNLKTCIQFLQAENSKA